MTDTAEMAAGLRARADEHMRQRKILLTASVALGTTKSAAAAIRALRDFKQREIGDQAIELIEQLTAQTKGIAL